MARLLTEKLGPNCLLTLDNCESLLDQSGNVPDGYLKDFITALVAKTGWRCVITSRESFDLEREGRTVCRIAWIPVRKMTFSERSALILV